MYFMMRERFQEPVIAGAINHAIYLGRDASYALYLTHSFVIKIVVVLANANWATVDVAQTSLRI